MLAVRSASEVIWLMMKYSDRRRRKVTTSPDPSKMGGWAGSTVLATVAKVARRRRTRLMGTESILFETTC